MKSIKLFVFMTLFLLVIGTNSCNEDKIDLEPTSDTEESYFTRESEFHKAVLGIYAKLSDFYWYNNGQNNCVIPVTYLPGDDITTNGDEEFERFTIQPTSFRVSYYFSRLYQVITRAIVVLDKNATVADGVYVTPNLKDYHRGEALFLRGWAYYSLWNLYGTAPLRTTRVTSLEELQPFSSTGTQLLDQAIIDLQEAATLLPDSWNDVNKGRVTANSGYGLLGKCLVFRASLTDNNADYQAAIAAFDNISGTTALTTDFADNFLADSENNEESLFEFQASSPGFDNVWLENDFDNGVGSMSAYWGFYSNHWSLFGKSRFTATQKLADLYEAGDPRKDATMDGDNNILKYVNPEVFTGSGVASPNNARILRYADVLLLKAEAINESEGSTADAIDLINEVRTRARGAGAAPADRLNTETDRGVIRQWIMDERLMELAGEGQRWFDIRRWHMAGQITLDNAFFDSALSPELMKFEANKHINLPIPRDETIANPNITQNTGY